MHRKDISGAAPPDGTKLPRSQMELGVTVPPFHPNCRGTTVPVIDETIWGAGERAARDAVTGETYYVPGDMTYAEWKAKQDALHGAGTVDRERKKAYNESKDREQWGAYRERLGDEAPSKFSDFQTIKYSNDSEYHDLVGYYRYKGENPDSDKRFWMAHNAMKNLYDEGKIRATGTLVAPPVGIVPLKPNAHAKARFVERGITMKWVRDTVDSADFALKQRKGTQYAFYTNEGFVVLNNKGEIGTAGRLDERGMELYKEVMKHVRDK